ncbi:hypothetical protein G9451_04430 [Enterobacter kobei]|uniref:hypothetical protein n=1 Tax=Enterobacter kobei TaxID=208224 RepID=UPI0018816737|nr:hypothetical protein [Enterobacter kobei]MBE8915153.1 hypothetical protein [Enterobacter kobei]
MKLIDILVQELPDLGGWPIGADGLYQNAKGHLIGVQGCIISPVDMELGIVAEDLHRSVTREQYEAALAASKPEWDGEGLPPVGCVCEVKVCGGYEQCEIVFSNPKSGVAYIYLDENEHGGKRPVDCISPIPAPLYFRPIRSEANKKKYATIEEMLSTFFGAPPVDEPNENDRVAMAELYDAIKSGKIVID